jgi:hypothetical protein
LSEQNNDDGETLCLIFNVHPKKLVGVKMKCGRARKMQNKWGGESKNEKTAAKVCSADMLTAKKWSAELRDVQTPCHNPNMGPCGRSKINPGEGGKVPQSVKEGMQENV